jgi:hypothetical protein
MLYPHELRIYGLLLVTGLVGLGVGIRWRAGRAGFLKQFKLYAPGAFLGACFSMGYAIVLQSVYSDLLNNYVGWIQNISCQIGLPWIAVGLERHFDFLFVVGIVYGGMIVGLFFFRNEPRRPD